ncbi:uncharacterized protein LOC101863359 [Aplysia californica]|uniref:Uncharacterized protein LOC101863359 n=1 Tax=Aplysia californica TaxID=6500 RepID=A0ABM1A4U2_APLCA|nr:uncharacterized protein LOC101863359 [Aplysia californica]
MSLISNREDTTMTMRYRHLEDVVVGDTKDQEQRAQREQPFTYKHLDQSERTLVEKLLKGCLKLEDTPKVKSKVIKVFISSTFTDFVEERNAMAQNVYPKLRDYCRDKYGVDFQAVDMRWGISQEARNDHSVTDLCMAELEHCQDLSIGPNFAALVGQKYGYCPLPAAMERMVFEAITESLKGEGPEATPTILDKCYLRDQNVTPSVYRLLEIDKCCEMMEDTWENIETELKEAISDGSLKAVTKGEITADTRRSLICSVTEQEIRGGMLGVKSGRERENNCVVLLRDIDDLFDNLEECNKTKRYCDITPGTNEVNGDAHVALNQMRGYVLESVPKFNVAVTQVHWTEDGITPTAHKDYLNRVTNHFYHTIRDLVDRNIQTHSELVSDSLYHEVIQHWSLVKSRCSTFVGREDQLQQLKKYLTTETSQALVVHGDSGVGKTSFMAKAVSCTRGLLAKHKLEVGDDSAIPVQLIPRFVGITPKSSSVQPLLFSLCHQLAFVTGKYRHEVPEDYKNLKRHFIDLVQKGDFPGIVVIFLDSLDQMGTSNGGHKMDWLPARLAPNVKIIVSTLPRKLDILSRLMNKIDYPMIEVCPLPASDCEAIIKVMLDSANRSVTLPQWRIIQEAFQKCTLPLYITLTFQEATRWRSYDVISPECLEYTVEASINKLFDRLETKHGKIFVSRALGYITAARSGLSEAELEDILSLDDQVLSALFTIWEPPIRRVPPSLWPRLYLDIHAFLVEREADEIVVLGWYHQQFLDQATNRYLSDYLDYNTIHRNIADYYLGTWSGTIKKPFLYGDNLMKRLSLKSPHGLACRYVPEQPLVFRPTEIDERYNYRKMTQLPYSLIHSCQFDRVKKDCLCNLEWLHTKLKATSLQQVILDMSMIEDWETDLVADVLRMSGSALKIDPDAIGAEISGRLLTHIHRHHWLKELVKQCDLVSQKRCPLVPQCQIYTAPGGPLQYECELDETVTSAVDVDVFNTSDGILMTAKPFYSTCLKVWELTQGEPRQDMHMPVGEVHPTRDGRYLAILKGGKEVLIFKTDCGELHGQIECGFGDVISVAMGNRYLALNIDRGVGPYLLDLWEAQLVHKFTHHSHAVAINADDSHVAFNTGTLVLVHSLPLMERRCVGQASDIPLQILFNAQATKLYILTQSKLLQVMKFDTTNRKTSTSDIISDMAIQDFKLSRSEKFVLVRCLRCLYLICTQKEALQHRLERVPPGVFVETMTCYTGADFNPSDSMVVASRYTYIFVWCTQTGNPIRILQASLSPILKIYTSDLVNKAVALLKDNTLQVWNLDNLDADVLHANEIMRGAIHSLAVSCASQTVLCHDAKHPEVKVVDLATGKAVGALMQAKEVHRVSQVQFCLKGIFAVTRNIPLENDDPDPIIRYHDDEETEKPVIKWEALTDDVLWHVESKKAVFKAQHSRFVVCNLHETAMGFITCSFHSAYDWTNNLYSFVMWEPTTIFLSGDIKGQEMKVDIPDMSEFLGPPVLHTDERNDIHTLLAVLQRCTKKFVGRNTESARVYDNVLFIQRLGKDKKYESQMLKIQDLLKFPNPKDRMAQIKIVSGNLALICYVKDVDHFMFDDKLGLRMPTNVEKGFILLNPIKNFVVKHTVCSLSPTSDLSISLLSSSSSVWVDNNLCVYNLPTNRRISQIEADVDFDSARLALDGRYLVGLCQQRRSLSVYRTEDGKRLARLFIHGTAACLEVGEDGRTVVAGCNDGRVLILSLVLECSDPYKEIIQKIPSRLVQQKKIVDRVVLLENDVADVESKKPELIRLAEKIRTDVKVAVRRQASFKTISKALISQQRAKSRACCIQ